MTEVQVNIENIEQKQMYHCSGNAGRILLVNPPVWLTPKIHIGVTQGGASGHPAPCVDDPVELLQHIGGVLPNELCLERFVGVGQVVCRLQDVLELGHCRLLQGWECEIELEVPIHHVQPVKRGFG